MPVGKVKVFDPTKQTYGFVLDLVDGKVRDLFFHHSEVIGFARSGDIVSYERSTRKGRLEAVKVQRV